ncbi:hypothetical protein [Paraburkholderia sp. J63]|uniref:hypothetical protein n=1 Tax=Paraburkholderia sp. J63 TaxID=2805434 RepID=UPI002ABD85EA|nr:hypothetical protein [Paraburkholderia sp. J63]
MSPPVGSTDSNAWYDPSSQDSQQTPSNQQDQQIQQEQSAQQTQQDQQTPSSQDQQVQQDQPPEQTQPSQQTQQTDQPQQPTSITTSMQVNYAQSQQTSTPAEASGAPAISPSDVPRAEAQHLVDTYESGKGYPDDETNAKALSELQEDGLRGESPDAIKFQTQQTQTRQKIEALPQKERERYSGMQAQGINVYESMKSPSDRAKVQQTMDGQVTQPVDTAYQKIKSDPTQRVPLEFNAPFGSQYLGSAGQQQIARLQQLHDDFNGAKTPEQRETVFRQAAELRHSMQLQIGSNIAYGKTQVDQQWAEADKELLTAQENANNMSIATLGDLDNTSSFERLKSFADNGLASERNVREFQYQIQHNPERFGPVKTWYADAAAKTEWARKKIQDDPFRRTPDLPGPLPDFTNMKTDDLRIGNYGAELLDRYKQANQGIAADQAMYHSASQGGPIREEYLNTHTPPKPLWQQRAEDVLGRFFVGMVPGVNLLTPWIVPANSLSQDAKNGIDLMSGVLSGMLGFAKLPSTPKPRGDGGGGATGRGVTPPGGEVKSGEGTGTGAKTETETGSNGESGEPPSGTEGGTGVRGGGSPQGTGTPTKGPTMSNIANVPAAYVSHPTEPLIADPKYRGIYRDSKGNGYIRQGDQTFAVSYQKDNGTWTVNAPRGDYSAPYPVRLNREGNWEPNADTGLKGGGGPKYTSLPGGGRTMYTDEAGRIAYESYESGGNYAETARLMGKSSQTTKAYMERYAKEHGLPVPYSVASRLELNWMSDGTGKSIYTDLSNGSSLADVANKYTSGNTLAAYRSAMRYARTNDVSTEPVVQFRPKGTAGEAGPASGAGLATTSDQPHVDPMTHEQFNEAAKLYDEGKLSREDIAKETGIPKPWVDEIAGGKGHWSDSQQGYVVSPRAPGSPSEPPAKVQRLTGPAEAEQAWGRTQVQQYINDPNPLDNETFNSIYDWLNENGPAPAGLQQAMRDQGFPNLTPDLVRAYLNPNVNAPLTTQQRIDIARWLGV